MSTSPENRWGSGLALNSAHPHPQIRNSHVQLQMLEYAVATPHIWVYGMLESVHRTCYQSTNLSQIEVSCSEGGIVEGFFFSKFHVLQQKMF